MTNKPRIAIIGGGYSGMAAAVRVVERGGLPVVFEFAKTLGGRARRIEYQDRLLDNGQHILSGAYRELLRLMNVVGISARVYDRVPLRLSMPPRFLMRAPLLPAPMHVAFALLTAKGLRWSERFAAVRMMRAIEKKQFIVSSDITVDALLLCHQQPQNLIDYLWQPLTISALNTPTATASAQIFVNVLRDALAGAREASDLLLPKVDLTALFPDPAAEWVIGHGGEVRLGTKVTGLIATPESVVVQLDGHDETFDAAILAVGPHQRAAFDGFIKVVNPRSFSGKNASNDTPVLAIEQGKSSLSPVRPEPAEGLVNDSNVPLRPSTDSGLTGDLFATPSPQPPQLPQLHDSQTPQHSFEPITTIYFGFETASSLPEAMFGQANGIAQWFFDRRQLSEDKQASELVVAAVISASGAHDALDQETLATKILAELRVHQPALPDPTWQKVIREKFATFACTPDAPRPTARTNEANVFLAGDDVINPQRLYPATIEGAVRNGVQAADLALDHCLQRTSLSSAQLIETTTPPLA